jgi:hypothetical protein
MGLIQLPIQSFAETCANHRASKSFKFSPITGGNRTMQLG